MPTLSVNAKQKKKLLTERLQYFKDEVNPENILPQLQCLTLEDQQEVCCEQRNHGQISAVKCLVDRLRRRHRGFEQFVVALCDTGLDHLALLLDPLGSVDPSDADASVVIDNEKFQIIGTAADVEVSVKIKVGNQRKVEFEEIIINEYKDAPSEQSRAVRKEFKKSDMPQGIGFVKTKQSKKPTKVQKNKNKNNEDANNDITEEATSSNEEPDNDEAAENWDDCFIVVFRLTTAEVARKFWDMYESEELEGKLREILVKSALLRRNVANDEDKLQLKLKMDEDDYQRILDFFEEKENEQDVESCGDMLHRRGPGNKFPELEDEINIRIPEVLLESHTSNVQKKYLKLREYQKELAHSAIEGRNTIICAPTNSGKTFVAMEIARNHLDKMYRKSEEDGELAVATNDTSREKPKVIFIVSTQNLVLQQKTRFEEHLTDYSVSHISGNNSTEIPLDFLLKTHDVIILTAQILLNALQKNSVKISQITLLVFDECHHTNKDHAYNKIMQNYMALKYSSTEDIRHPQIIGLTASLGVGRSNETEKAKNHILQICANMDAYCISTVRENVEELEKNVTGGVPRRKLVKVDQQANIFEKVIVQVMEKIEIAAQRYSPNSSSAPADRVGQPYRQWVESLEKEAVSKALRDLSTYASHLRRYHISLLINDTVRVKDAIQYLEEFFEHLDQSKFQVSDKKLQDLYLKATNGIKSRIEKAEPKNPKLEELKELILNFHEEDKSKVTNVETKGILFTRTRDSTKGIVGWIQETQELKAILRPKVLVGAGDGEVGMTQGEQEAIIEEFKKGEVNILIATTVAEEGLDIGDCNFVIRYNMAGNEISSVQSRGRIRADEGNYVYVGDSRSKGVNREKLNQYREMLMTTAVAEVQQMERDVYLDKIKEVQKKDLNRFQMKSYLSSRKIKVNQEVDDVMFFCRRCNEMACHLREFRRLKDNYHVILVKEFQQRIHIKPKKKSKKIDDILMDSQVHCAECDEDWGVTVKIDGLTWPCLKIRSFAVKLPDKKRTTYKKWSEFPYEIPEATLEEIIEVDDTLDDGDLNLDV